MPRNRFQRADQADSDCTPASDGNKPLLSTQTGGNQTLSASIAQGAMNQITFSFSTASGDPGTENLGAGSLFRMQLDVTVAGGNLTYRVEFHAVNNACVSQGNVVQGEASFSGIGLRLASATWDPPSAERYQAHILVSHGGMHSDPAETITIRTNNSDAFYEFPDAPAVDERYQTRVMRQAGGYFGFLLWVFSRRREVWHPIRCRGWVRGKNLWLSEKMAA